MSHLAPELHSLPQVGSDLGERLTTAFAAAFAADATSVVVIGTDSPDLPIDYIEQAFHLLESCASDAVIGPSIDGGYYLLGTRKLWPMLFCNIPWSTPEVLSSSLRNAEAAGCSTCFLPQWYDIDTIIDLQRLAQSPGNAATYTKRFIASHLTKHLLQNSGSISAM